MITMRQVGTPESVTVDFDEYVPLTVTWASAGGLLEPPEYAGFRGENGYLELKFHPRTGILIEAVLAAASRIEIEEGNLSPRSSGDGDLMPFLGPGDTRRETECPVTVKAYPDCLYVSFGHGLDQWAGSGPVLFGLAADQSLTAICARWTRPERESVLAGM